MIHYQIYILCNSVVRYSIANKTSKPLKFFYHQRKAHHKLCRPSLDEKSEAEHFSSFSLASTMAVQPLLTKVSTTVSPLFRLKDCS
mmetsp:Transcript_14304/g.30048  ORF Transcript_14304/g.30048 Transcript_14304/m.30048 type:complete len:86 (+) Transcript_14304:176-433(+)